MRYVRQLPIRPTDTGYLAECECGWSKEYAARKSARGGLAAHKCRPPKVAPR
jgi:hypothetical protein